MMAPTRATRLSAVAALLALAAAQPTPSSSPASPSPSYGALKELVVLDCNGGLHLFPNTPMEVNVNLRGARHLVNYAADEIRDRAQCVSNLGW